MEAGGADSVFTGGMACVVSVGEKPPTVSDQRRTPLTGCQWSPWECVNLGARGPRKLALP